MTGPYAYAAADYWSAGWRGVLPLPPRRKEEPPTGYTGWNGRNPSYPDLMAWVEDRGAGNIALHLPDGVLGIDVDQYGSKVGGDTLAHWEAEHGPLPATWRTTSRDNVSGIRLFRVPMAGDGVSLAWPSEIKPDIQLVHRGHRYMVVPPSIHPDTGKAYRWIAPDGSVSTDAPRIADLPELPMAWVIALTQGREAHVYQGANMTDAEIKAWLGELNHGDGPCGPMDAAADEAIEGMAGGAHDSLRMLMRLVGLAAAGHTGLFNALHHVRSAFIAEVAKRRGGEDKAIEEWTRSLMGAADKIAGEMAKTGTEVNHGDPCELFVLDPPQLETLTEPSPAVDNAVDAADEPSDDTAPRVLTAEERRAMAVEREYQNLAIRKEAQRRIEAEGAPALQLLGFGDFLASPEPEPVVDRMLYVDSLARIYGKPGCGKSFLALDLAFHVALGMDWGGQPVRQGPVVYVMAEGQRVNTHRAKAWLERHHVEPTELEGKFWAVPDKVLLTEAAAAPFVNAVTELAPTLIILDTQNAMQVGEENSGSDTRIMRDALDAMRHATQACVVLIGHTGKTNQDSARGSGAAEAAMDTEVKVENDGGSPGHVTVTVSRDKAAEDGAEWEFFLRMQSIPDHDKPGAVLVPMGEDVELPTRTRETDLAWRDAEGIAVPTELLHFEGPGATAMPDLARYMASEASAKANDPNEIGRSRSEATNALKLAGHSKGSVWRAWSALIDRGDIDTAEGVKTPHGRHVWAH